MTSPKKQPKGNHTMLTHIIILYVACAGLILWQYLSLKQEEKVIEELKFLSARIHYLEQKGK
jgi:hypothetical protein